MTDRVTHRIAGQNVGIGDMVVAAFATEETVASVGIVGTVRRIRAFDEQTGDPIRHPGHRAVEVEIWIEDNRTGSLCGPIRRSELETLMQIDGPWLDDDEMRQHLGDDWQPGRRS